MEPSLETSEITIEQLAMEKVINPWRKPYPYWTRAGFQKLDSILKHGWVSKNYALRNKIPYESRRNNPWNDYYASVWTRQEPLEVLPRDQVVFLIAGNKVDPIDPHDIEPELRDRGYKSRGPFDPLLDEGLVRDRIPPSAFMGIIIGGRVDLFKPDESRPRLNSQQIGKLMAKNPELALPVYFNAELIWPRKMTKSEIDRMLGL